jgi:hypothetical protein
MNSLPPVERWYHDRPTPTSTGDDGSSVPIEPFTKRPLPVGNQVFLEVARPGMKSFKLVGRVLAVVPLKKSRLGGAHGVSIRFNPMGEELTQRLEGLISAIYNHSRLPAAPPSPVRVALAQPPRPRPPSPDFDFEFSANAALAEHDVSEAVVGKAAATGGQFDSPRGRSEFDFEFSEPLATSAQEPGPAAVAVPASARLTARVRDQDASPDALRAMLEERDRDLRRLQEELERKNEQLEKLRRAVLELRRRNKPVL